MTNKWNKLSGTFAAGALLFAGAGAARLFAADAPAVNWDQTLLAGAPSAANEEISAGFKALGQKMDADVFQSVPACSIVDAKTFRAYFIDEAVRNLQPCMLALSQRYAARIGAEQGMVGVNDGRGIAVGIQVRIQGAVEPGGRALADLNYSVGVRRHGSLMGFPAAVVVGSTSDGLKSSGR